MLDPVGPPPAFLAHLIQPFATMTNLTTLPLHIHEVIFFALFYHSIMVVVSPMTSRWLVPKYREFNRRTRISWDIHVVSLVQSCTINSLALYIMFADKERANMSYKERIWGYSGALGLMQAMALGYFLWDLYVCTRYLSIFGPGMLAHAMSAVTVFSFGFRPFVNYYCPVFLLYELSSPFLNFHWFFDKLNMTGTRAQLYNGIALILTFLGCRLIWGSYQSASVFWDMYRAMQYSPEAGTLGNEELVAAAVTASTDAAAEIMQYAGNRKVPLWLAGAYLASNVTLNALNWYWFRKMIHAVQKRFTPDKARTKMEVDSDGRGIREESVKTSIVNGGSQVVEVDRIELRQRK